MPAVQTVKYQGTDVSVAAVAAGGGVVLAVEVSGLDFTLTLQHTMYRPLNEQWERPLTPVYSGTGTLHAVMEDSQVLSKLTGQATMGIGIRSIPQNLVVTCTISAPEKVGNGKRVQLTGCQLTGMTRTIRDSGATITNDFAFLFTGYVEL